MAKNDSARKVRPLTIRERAFLSELFESGLNATEAYVRVMAKNGKEVSRANAEVQGCRMRRRICSTAEFADILSARGLDAVTLADDINRLRTMQRPAFDRDGNHVGDFNDGQVQLGAAKLISEALGVIEKPGSTVVIENISIGLPPKPEDIPAEGAPGA
jgi:hypothetical protein